MSLKSRVGSLERELGDADSEFCTCPGEVRITWGGEQEEETTCERCGKPIKRVVIKWPEDV